MKLLFPVLLLLSGLVFSQNTIPDDFRKIPEILDNTDLLYPFIIPARQYQYWTVFQNDLDPEKAVIYESQMPEHMTINDPAPERGFFQKCLGNNCFSYIIACSNSKSEYFSSEEQLRNFIGYIDNLPEAILIAKTYGFTLDIANKLTGSYQLEDHHINMYLAKASGCNQESFLITINRKTGKLQTKSQGMITTVNCNP